MNIDLRDPHLRLDHGGPRPSNRRTVNRRRLGACFAHAPVAAANRRSERIRNLRSARRRGGTRQAEAGLNDAQQR